MKFNKLAGEFTGRGGLFQPQEPFYEVQVSLADFAFFGHHALAFLAFLGEDMTFERFLEGNLTRAGNLKPLFGTGVRFDLGHSTCFLYNPLLADPHRRNTYGAVWGGEGR